MAKTMTNDQLLVREYVKQQFSTQQFAEESTYFEFLAASQALRDCDLSDEEIETGLTGKGGDGGCDGVYLFFNDVLVGEELIENLTEIPRGAILQMYII